MQLLLQEYIVLMKYTYATAVCKVSMKLTLQIREGTDQGSQVSDVGRLGQEVEGLAHTHVGLLLLLLGLASSDPWDHGALQCPVGQGDQQAAKHHHAHHALQTVAPPVNTGRQLGSHLPQPKQTESRASSLQYSKLFWQKQLAMSM